MNRIDNADWIPPAMLYLYKQKPEFDKFLLRLEALAGTAMVLRRNFNWRMSKYAILLREIEKDEDVFSKKSSMEISKEDKLKIIEALNGNFYTDLKDSAKRYVLLRLDSLLSSGQPYYNHTVITVEHVLPQNPSVDSIWLKEFPEPEKYVHRLGNLVLLTRKKNAQAKNYEFDRKKKAYFQSSKGVTSFALTTQVIQASKWAPVTIERRQKELMSLLTKTWKLI